MAAKWSSIILKKKVLEVFTEAFPSSQALPVGEKAEKRAKVQNAALKLGRRAGESDPDGPKMMFALAGNRAAAVVELQGSSDRLYVAEDRVGGSGPRSGRFQFQYLLRCSYFLKAYRCCLPGVPTQAPISMIESLIN